MHVWTWISIILPRVGKLLKVPGLKLEKEFSLTDRYGHFSNKYIIQSKNIANEYLISKQFEKTMFMLLLVL